MTPAWRNLAACAALVISALAWRPAFAEGEFSFGVIAHPAVTTTEGDLQEAITQTDAANLAFVVVNGIKSAAEPCSDALYRNRLSLVQNARNGVIISLAENDWADCRSANGSIGPIGRLNRLRELFFSDEFSLGGSRLPLLRQSATPRFRSYVENARWELNHVLFATINLPADNNHYRPEAGRNSEFEDRLIANRDWLHRIRVHAARGQIKGIVLFCDGNPLAPPRHGARRDGFAETRRQIAALAAKFQGKVLLVHGQQTEVAPGQGIRWNGNLGELGVPTNWTRIDVAPDTPRLFGVESRSSEIASAKRAR